VIAYERAWGSDSSDLEKRRQQVLAACDAFVDNRTALRLLFGYVSRRYALASMKILSPGAGVRIFGGFLDETVFIGCSYYLREQLPFKPRKKTATTAIDWKTLTEQTRHQWERLITDVKPRLPASIRRR
jgi:hypothetical protein